jgi:hypothetical protein
MAKKPFQTTDAVCRMCKERCKEAYKLGKRDKVSPTCYKLGQMEDSNESRV